MEAKYKIHAQWANVDGETVNQKWIGTMREARDRFYELKDDFGRDNVTIRLDGKVWYS